MDFSWNEQQTSVRELAAKILGSEITEASLREVDRAGTFFHTRAWGKLAEAGLLGVAIDEELGGLGGGALELVALLEHVGRHVAPLPALACLALGALPVQRFGSDAIKRRWLTGVANGSTLLTGAWAEDAHSTTSTAHASAERAGAGYVVSGEKLCVPFATDAARIVCTVSEAGRIGIVLVDPHAEGVTFVKSTATHGEPVFRLRMQRVRVAADDVLVAPGDARADESVRWMEQAATACVCAVSLGVASRALEITAKYTAERKQFGVPIGSFQAVRQRAADAYIDVNAMRLTMLQAAFLVSEGKDAALATCVAKRWACEGGYRVTFAAQHLHGGIGYDVDYPLHRFYLWAKAMELTLGTAPAQLARIGSILAERTSQSAE